MIYKIKVVLVIGIFTASVSYAFFNMPQKMMNNASQMMFPAQDKAEQCTCICKTN